MTDLSLKYLLYGEDRTASSSLRGVGKEAESTSSKIGAGATKIGAVVGVAVLSIAAASVKMGADFQEATTKLITGAGESEKNIALVRQGLIAMAPAVGMGPEALAKAMFLVESAGFHGAAGLNVMKAAAEGAKIGGADATVVANGLTTALTDYHLPASAAADVTSRLVATVAAGKTDMAALAGSLSSVLPAAASAGVGLTGVLAAMATMTGQGVSADQAAQNLANTIRSLSNPSAVASKAMAQMGLNSTTVAKNLGQKGLTGTLTELTGAILKHMGPAGLVLQSSFNQSSLAAQSANAMLKGLPPSLQALAKGYLAGTVTQKEWTKELRGQPALTANLGKQFATTAKAAHGFSDDLKAGGGAAKTYNALLSDMLGGATGLNTGLALSGANMKTFAGNTDNISRAAVEAGGHVKGWAETQKDFNVKIDQAKAYVASLGVKIGTALIPVLSSTVDWMMKNKDTVGIAAAALGSLGLAIGVAGVGLKAYNIVQGISAVLSGETAAKTGLQTLALGVQKGALGISTVAQWALNAAMTANPIGLVIAAIALLVGAIVLIATKTTWFQTIWEYTSHAIGAAWKWLWNTILQPVIKFILDGFSALATMIGKVLVALGNIPGFGWAKTAGQFMLTAAGGAQKLADNIKKIPDKKDVGINVRYYVTTSGKAPNLGGSAKGVFNVPGHAGGTGFFGGGLSWVGEQGPELVSLPRGTQIHSNPNSMAMARRGAGDRMTHAGAGASGSSGVSRLHPADIAAIGGAVADGMKSAASSVQLVSRNRPVWG